MEGFFINYLVLLAWSTGLGFVGSNLVWWFWWAMGSPQQVDSTSPVAPAKAANGKGLLLSSIGAWIVTKYNSLEKKRWELRKAEVEKSGLDWENPQDRMQYAKGIEEGQKLNFWKAAGVCIYCFTPYASTIFYLAACLFFAPPLWLVLGGWAFYIPLCLYFIRKK